MSFCTIGKIVKTHGLKGHVKMLFFSENLDSEVVIVNNQTLHIEDFNLISEERSIVKFKEINSIEEAAKLAGNFVTAEQEELYTNEIYLDELIGMKIVNHDNKHIATVKSVFDFGTGTVLDTEFNTMIHWNQVDDFDKTNKTIKLSKDFDESVMDKKLKSS